MSEGIKKIDFIKNMAVFHDFRWTSSVRDDSNNVAEFKKINILYGRNYSGKTDIPHLSKAIFDLKCSPLKFTKGFDYKNLQQLQLGSSRLNSRNG